MSLLLGNDVYLRRLDERDLPQCLIWANDPEIFLTMGIWGPRTASEQNEWFKSIYNSRTNIVFAICLTNNDEHIGNTSIFDIDYRNRNAGITIFVYEKTNRSKGYGEDALRILIEYAFDYLNLHKIHCKTNNLHAAHLYEKLGFLHEGTLREHSYHCGKYIDKLVYGLLSHNYLRR